MNIILRTPQGRIMSRYGPFFRPVRLFNQIDTILRGFRQPMEDALAPRLDVTEEKGKLVVRGEFPGVKREDIDITLKGRRLEISAKMTRESAPAGDGEGPRETYSAHYYRLLPLPSDVDAEKARATYDEGLVTLRVPLVPGVEPKETKVRIRKARTKRPEAVAAEST